MLLVVRQERTLRLDGTEERFAGVLTILKNGVGPEVWSTLGR